MPRQLAIDQAFQARQPGGGHVVRALQQGQVALLQGDLVQQGGQFAGQAPGLLDCDGAAAGRKALY